MRTRYESCTELDDVLNAARRLLVQTLIVDIEPMVSWWDGTQESLDRSVASVAARAGALPTLRALVFATNSARRPSSVPAEPGIAVSYLARAWKPLRTSPYRGLPLPGAVAGDQVHTDGLLARRLGFTFLHYQPRLAGVPAGPAIMHRLGRAAVRSLFSSTGADVR